MPKRNDNTRKQNKLKEKNKKKITKRKQFRKGKLVSLKKNMKQRMAKGFSNERPSKRRKCTMRECTMSRNIMSNFYERSKKARYESSPINYRWGEGNFSPTDDDMVEAVLKLSEEKMQSLSKEGKKNLREMLDSRGTFIFKGTLRSLVEKRYIPFNNDDYASGYWSTSMMFNITMARPIKGKPPPRFSIDINQIESEWRMYQAEPREAQSDAPGGYKRMDRYKRYIKMYLQSTGNPVAYHMINQEFGGGPVMPASHDLNTGIKSFENTLKNLKDRIFTDINFDASEKEITIYREPRLCELAMVVSCIRPSWEDETAMSYNDVYINLELPEFTSNNRIFNNKGGITAVVRHVISFGVIAMREKSNRFFPKSPEYINHYWYGFIDFINNSSTDGKGLEKLGFSDIRDKRGNLYLFESEIKQQYRINSNSRLSMAAAVDSPSSPTSSEF